MTAKPDDLCFVAGTVVLTESGPKAIEAVEAGEKVWAYDHETKAWELAEVAATHEREVQTDLVEVTVTLADGSRQTIEATGNHPFWVDAGEGLAARPLALEHAGEDGKYVSPSGGRWIEARHLKLGDRLLAYNFESATVTGLRVRTERLMVYNLTVARLRDYAVGRAGLLVHNNNPCAAKPAPKPNDGNAKPHGNPDHNTDIDNRISQARDEGATNIRKNQQQVDIDGNKVGSNRPDAQWDQNGKHHNYETDHRQSNSDRHKETIEKNDPNSVNEFNTID